MATWSAAVPEVTPRAYLTVHEFLEFLFECPGLLRRGEPVKAKQAACLNSFIHFPLFLLANEIRALELRREGSGTHWFAALHRQPRRVGSS